MEQLPKGKVEKSVRPEEYPELKAYWTFNFSINEKRKELPEMIESMIKSGEVDSERLERLIEYLESDDFVERLAMLYLFGKIRNLQEQERKKITERVLPVLEKLALAENEDGSVRERAIEALGNLGEIALPVLKELAQDKRYWIRGEAAIALGKLGEIDPRLLKEEVLPLLKELVRDEEGWVKGQVALALGKLGNKIDPHLLKEEVLPLLIELVWDKDSWVGSRAIQALGNVGEIALPVLQELARNKESWFREQAALALGELGNKIDRHLLKEIILPLLKELAGDHHVLVREHVALALGKLGEIDLHLLKEEVLPLLKELAQDKDRLVKEHVALALGKLSNKIDRHLLEEEVLPLLIELAGDYDPRVRGQVARALVNLGEMARPVLKKLADNDIDMWVRKQAALALDVLDKIKSRSEIKSWLLDNKELTERISEIQKIAEEMEKEFGDRFIGIVIIPNGYFAPIRSLEWYVIAKDIRVLDYFEKRAKELGFHPRNGHYVEADKDYKFDTEIMSFFYGFFFGNRKMFREVQKNTLESINPQKWDGARRIIQGNVFDSLEAALGWFGIDVEEDEEMKRIVADFLLRRVPPPYDEALDIVRKRAGY